MAAGPFCGPTFIESSIGNLTVEAGAVPVEGPTGRTGALGSVLVPVL